MFQEILEKLKKPVSVIIYESEQEDLKKSGIKLAIISAVMALINIITSVITIIKKYSKDSFWYSSYSSSELWDKRWEAIKDAELFSSFLKNWIIMAIVLAVGALILFLIAKFVKSPKEYTKNLSMINNTAIIGTAGNIVSTILSLIYAPLGILVTFATIIYATFSLIFAFKDTLQIENSDKLVIVTTGVLVSVVIIIFILLSVVLDVSLKDISTITSLLNF